MKKKETKKQKLIDSNEAENELNEDAAPDATKDHKDQSDEEDDLPEGQLKELDDALADSHIGETLTLEEFKEAMDRLRTQKDDPEEE